MPGTEAGAVAAEPHAEGRRRLREVLKLSIPIMLTQFMITIGGFLNNLMLSRVDAPSFAAGLMVNAIQLALVTVVLGILYSMSALIGKIVGEGRNEERIGALFAGGCAVALAIALPSMLLLSQTKPLLLAAGQPEALAELSRAYFEVYVWAIPAVALMSVYIQLLLGTQRQGAVFLYSVASILVSTLLGYWFVFGGLGLPALGIAGLGWAALATSWAAFAWLTWFILTREDNRRYRILAASVSRIREAARDIVRVGFPISVQMGNEIFSFLVTTIMVGWLGLEALAAQQVATRYLMLLVIPIIGLSQAATITVSRQFGAGNLSEMRRYGSFALALGLAYSGLVLLAFLLSPGPLIGLFLEDPASAGEAWSLLPLLLVLIGIGQLFDGARNIATGALRGLQDTQYPMRVSLVMIWVVGVPLAWWMGFGLGWGLIGITVAHDIVMMVGCALILQRWRQRVRSIRGEESKSDALNYLST